jgi:hypothetical protein
MTTIKSLLKTSANNILRYANARIESLTLERMEEARLRKVEASGYFERRPFPIPPCMEGMRCEPILQKIASLEECFRSFDNVALDATSFSFANGYFTSPDAEVLCAVIALYRPSTFLEVGSGNSTKLARNAITSIGCNTRIVSIDPEPRAAIDDIVDVCIRKPVEDLEPAWLAGQLREGDVLFIDSSHALRACSDVAFLYLRLLPLLRAGVVVHIHDIFFPYDYPREWIVEARWPWNEQYLVQTLLTFSEEFEVIWAGHFIQRDMPGFERSFPRAKGRLASSLWLRKRTAPISLPWTVATTSAGTEPRTKHCEAQERATNQVLVEMDQSR